MLYHRMLLNEDENCQTCKVMQVLLFLWQVPENLKKDYLKHKRTLDKKLLPH